MNTGFNFNKHIYIPPPCGRCEKRQPACHDTCGDFKAYRGKLDKIKIKEKVDRLSGNERRFKIRRDKK